MKYILFIISILQFNSTQCQDASWASHEFLIGMFNDYNGVEFLLDHPIQKDQLTYFWCSDYKKSQLFIEKLERLAERSKTKINIISDANTKVLSSGLIYSFHKFFKIQKKPKSWQVEYDNEEEIEFGIYKANLKHSKFNTKHKKLMFLSGAIIRYGEFLSDKIVVMKFINSPNHYDASIKFLRKLKFQIIETRDCDKNIVPCTRSIKFKTNQKYSNEFNNLRITCDKTKSNVDDCQ